MWRWTELVPVQETEMFLFFWWHKVLYSICKRRSTDQVQCVLENIYRFVIKGFLQISIIHVTMGNWQFLLLSYHFTLARMVTWRWKRILPYLVFLIFRVCLNKHDVDRFPFLEKITLKWFGTSPLANDDLSYIFMPRFKLDIYKQESYV